VQCVGIVFISPPIVYKISFMNRAKPSDDLASSVRSETTRVPVVEEQLHVGVRKDETGVVRAIKKVHEEKLVVSGPTFNDDVKIERVPLNQYIDVPPQVRHEGDTMIIPVVKEEVIVQTRLVLVEEVRITKRQVQVNSEHPVTLRREEVVVERSSEGSDPEFEREK
jgi:uncharacterized protein (TIGR02271 family)